MTAVILLPSFLLLSYIVINFTTYRASALIVLLNETKFRNAELNQCKPFLTLRQAVFIDTFYSFRQMIYSIP